MKDNLKIRKLGRILLAFLATCFLVLMIWIVVDCFTDKKTATDKIITYNVKDNINYIVTLKDNQFYTNDEVNNKNKYITSLMDTLQVDFKYDLVGSRFFSGVYNYDVVLKLISVDGEQVIWEYEEEVLSQVNESLSDVMKMSIADNFSIDINHLYTKAQEFYDLTGYSVNLEIYVNIHSNLLVMGYDDGIEDNQVLMVSFPLTEKMVSITKTTDNNVNNKILYQYEVDEEFNIYLFITSTILIVLLTPLTIRSYISLFNLINLDNYHHRLKKIKRKYKHLIGEESNKPNFKDKEIINVIDYRELVYICNEKDLLINIYERVKGKECWFYVIDKKDVYVYTLVLDYRQIDMSKMNLKKKKSK